MLVVAGDGLSEGPYYTICKTVSIGLADRMPLTYLILAFLSVCSFIRDFFNCCLKGSVSHYTTSFCISLQQSNDVIELHVWLGYAHPHLFFWVYECEEEMTVVTPNHNFNLVLFFSICYLVVCLEQYVS